MGVAGGFSTGMSQPLRHISMFSFGKQERPLRTPHSTQRRESLNQRPEGEDLIYRFLLAGAVEQVQSCLRLRKDRARTRRNLRYSKIEPNPLG